MLKAVIFDLFETLITQYDPNFHSKEKIGLAQILGSDDPIYQREYDQTQRARHLGQIKTRRKIIAKIAEKFNLTINADVLQVYEDIIDRRKTKAFQHLDADVLTMLGTIKNLGLKIGVITNCEYMELKYYQASKLTQYVDQILFSCEENLAKPDEEIYQKALLQLGLTKQECIYVGDGGNQELHGAQAVGISAFQAFWFIKKFEQAYQDKQEQAFKRLYHPLEVQKLLEDF